MTMTSSLTTGQVAKLVRLSQQTIIRAIDRGHLVGYKIPMSGHRRVMLSDLRKWMRATGIPEDLVDEQFGLDQSEQAEPVSNLREAGLVPRRD